MGRARAGALSALYCSSELLGYVVNYTLSTLASYTFWVTNRPVQCTADKRRPVLAYQSGVAEWETALHHRSQWWYGVL
jgi:hypothetical protein